MQQHKPTPAGTPHARPQQSRPSAPQQARTQSSHTSSPRPHGQATHHTAPRPQGQVAHTTTPRPQGQGAVSHAPQATGAKPAHAGKPGQHRGGSRPSRSGFKPHGAKKHFIKHPHVPMPKEPTYGTLKLPKQSDGQDRTLLDPRGKPSKKLRVSIVGGAEEVGRNCTMLEYDGDIIIIDIGLQFPEEDQPGIDYIIPNMTYMRERKNDIKGVVITHAHMDHIGGISHVIEDLGNPIIYTGKLTKGIIEKRHENYYGKPKLKFVTVDKHSKLKLGKFNVEFFHVNHNIINCFGIVVSTPSGTVLHTGDFKFDDTPLNDEPSDYARLKELGEKGVDVLLADSTNAMQPGKQISEYTVTTELDKIFAECKGRMIVGTFASNLNRIQQCITLAEKYGRKVILEGRSINSNVEIAHQLNFLQINTKNILTSEEYVRNRAQYPNNKIIIVGTGAQGESNAFMMKYVTGEHRTMHAEPGDTCIFSSSVIPGNERTVSNLKDSLARRGCHIIHYALMDVHAGGHARQDDIKLLLDLLKPRYYVPIEQSHYALQQNGMTAIAHGVPHERVFMTDNGRILEFEKKDGVAYGEITNFFIPSEYVFVDGLGVGDVSEVVLRDRMILANDGMIVVIATIDHRNGKVVGNPDLISRGFIYMKDNKDIVEETRAKVKKICLESDLSAPAFDDYIKNKVRDELGEFFWKKTQRRPMILPVVIKV